MREKVKKLLVIASSTFLVMAITSGSSPVQAANKPVVDASYNCNSYTYPSSDDSSFQMNLPFTLKLGDTEYDKVFASTNGVLSFGFADITYWDYPNTPSISLAGWDWVTWGDGAYMRYGTTANTLCIEWAVRPYPQSSGDVTYFTLLVTRSSNGDWSGQILSDGWFPDNLRRGIRYAPNEPVVVISSAFQVGSGGVPVETKGCWDGSTIPVTESCPAEPQPTVQTRVVSCTWTNPYTNEVQYGTANQRYYLYWDNTTTDIDTVAVACAAAAPEFPTPLPVQRERTITCRGLEPVTGSAMTWSATQRYNLYWDGHTEDIETSTDVCARTDGNLSNVDAIVVLDNGVELTVPVAQALALFESPSALIGAIFTNPSQVITAVMNIGADMTPAQRKQAQKTIVSAVVVTQVITSTSAITLIRK